MASAASAAATRFVCPNLPHKTQDLFQLSGRIHDAFARKNFDEFRSFFPEIEAYMELMRPGEVAMLTNHLARLPPGIQRANDVDRIWRRVSEHVHDILVDCEGHTLSIMLNAFAVGKRTDDKKVLYQLVDLLPQRVGDMNARSVCMVINAFARLEITHDAAMEALVGQVQNLAPTFNSIDVATVTNGLAKLNYPNAAEIFEMLPVAELIPKCSPSHVSMIANAYSRIRCKDEKILRLLAERAYELTENGRKPYPADFLPSLVHALAVRFNFTPTPLVRTVACTLPFVAYELTLADVVLSIPALARMSELATMEGWSEEIVQRIARDMTKFHGHALGGILYALAKLGVGKLDFWEPALTYLCDVCLPKGDLWTMERYSALSLVLSSEIVQSTGGLRFFDAVSETCEKHTWTPRAVASQAFAYAKHDLMDTRVFDFFAETAEKALRSNGEWTAMDCAQFIWAIAKLDLRYPELLLLFDHYIADNKAIFTDRAFDIIFSSFAQLEFQPKRLRDEFVEFGLTKGKIPRLLGSEEIMADDM
eukprot:GEMP01027601.1.p1 GENE.GEMP01027601.1~~GEMP01027601.1.p1  ORF type:complete len:536 (+),score=130.80 GEMP01027601.1:173-1780(+)